MSTRADEVVLEPQTAEHAEEMFVVLSDPALYQYEGACPESVGWLRQRFLRLEAGLSADGRDRWFNWVVRIKGGHLIGYVQATVPVQGRTAIAYVLSSQYWGKGLASSAVSAMMAVLTSQHGVREFMAVLKRDNVRSQRLLERLSFRAALLQQYPAYAVEHDEMLMFHDA